MTPVTAWSTPDGARFDGPTSVLSRATTSTGGGGGRDGAADGAVPATSDSDLVALRQLRDNYPEYVITCSPGGGLWHAWPRWTPEWDLVAHTSEEMAGEMYASLPTTADELARLERYRDGVSV